MATTDAVLFDLGNTVVRYYSAGEFTPVLRRCMNRVLDAAGVPGENIDIEELLAAALVLNTERDDYVVTPLWERLHDLLSPITDLITADKDGVTRAFLEPIFECAAPDPDALHVLDELRRRGVRTAIVSNTPWGSPAEPWHDELRRHGLLERVDAAVFCVDTGYRKPHPAPLLRALELLSVAPSRAVFVGDDPRWDVAGAQAAGMRPVLLSGESQRQDVTIISKLDQILTWC